MKLQKSKKVAAAIILTVGIGFGIVFFLPNAILYSLGALLGDWSAAEIQLAVQSTADDRPIFTFEQGSIKYSRHPFINFEVSEVFPAAPKDPKVVWDLQEEMRRWEDPVRSITFGECPQGFKEIHVAEPLQTGHFYRVLGHIFTKNGPHQYEVIPYARYAKSLKYEQTWDFKPLKQ